MFQLLFSWHSRVTETAEDHQLSPLDLIAEVIAAKIDTPERPPLILQYQDRHYLAFLHSGQTSRLPDFKAEEDLIESPAQVSPEHSTRTPLASTEVPNATQQAAPMAVADLICRASLDPDHITSDDCDSCTDTSRVPAVAERRLMLPPIPLTPPRGPRLAPPPDRKRGLCTSPENDPSSGAMVQYQPTATVPKKGRVGTAPPRRVTTDAYYDRIDRGDWASA